MKLVQLLTRCIDLEITQGQVDDLDQGFQDWVRDYELYIFQPLTYMEWY